MLIWSARGDGQQGGLHVAIWVGLADDVLDAVGDGLAVAEAEEVHEGVFVPDSVCVPAWRWTALSDKRTPNTQSGAGMLTGKHGGHHITQTKEGMPWSNPIAW